MSLFSNSETNSSKRESTYQSVAHVLALSAQIVDVVLDPAGEVEGEFLVVLLDVAAHASGLDGGWVLDHGVALVGNGLFLALWVLGGEGTSLTSGTRSAVLVDDAGVGDQVVEQLLQVVLGLATIEVKLEEFSVLSSDPANSILGSHVTPPAWRLAAHEVWLVDVLLVIAIICGGSRSQKSE